MKNKYIIRIYEHDGEDHATIDCEDWDIIFVTRKDCLKQLSKHLKKQKIYFFDYEFEIKAISWLDDMESQDAPETLINARGEDLDIKDIDCTDICDEDDMGEGISWGKTLDFGEDI